jgi:hypothetical protein
LAIFRQNTQIFLEVISPTMDPLFRVLCIIRFYFNILRKLSFVSESIVLLTCWLELHRLSPEFSFDSSFLAENKVSRFCIAYTYGRMVAHLVTTNQRCTFHCINVEYIHMCIYIYIKFLLWRKNIRPHNLTALLLHNSPIARGTDMTDRQTHQLHKVIHHTDPDDGDGGYLKAGS